MNILAIYAHPDDAEFFASGSLAKWASEGHEIYAICCTNGNIGTLDNKLSSEELASIRKKELFSAMKVIGGHKPIGFWFPDGCLREYKDELEEKLSYWIRKLKPDRIITFDPWQKYEIHPDHMITGLIASEVATFTAFPLYFPKQITEELLPHQTQELWYMVPTLRKVNRIVDITNTFDKKVRSLLCHRSQLPLLSDILLPDIDPYKITEDDLIDIENSISDLLSMLSSSIGNNFKIDLAEAFYCVKCSLGHFDDALEKMSEVFSNIDDDAEIH